MDISTTTLTQKQLRRHPRTIKRPFIYYDHCKILHDGLPAINAPPPAHCRTRSRASSSCRVQDDINNNNNNDYILREISIFACFYRRRSGRNRVHQLAHTTTISSIKTSHVYLFLLLFITGWRTASMYTNNNINTKSV